MNLTSEDHNGLQVITVNETRIDSAASIQFKDRMRDLTADRSDRVVLDLAQVGFMDSSGLGALVTILKFLGADRKLMIAGLSPTVAKVFKLTRMDKFFTIFQDVMQAKSAQLRPENQLIEERC